MIYFDNIFIDQTVFKAMLMFCKQASERERFIK